MQESSSTTRTIVLSLLVGAGAGVVASALTIGSLFTYMTELDALLAPFRLSAERLRGTPRTSEEQMERIRTRALPTNVALFFQDARTPDGVLQTSRARRAGDGITLTSDGWLLVGSVDGKNLSGASAVVGGEAYSISRLEAAGIGNLWFAKIDAGNLPVPSFGKGRELEAGDQVAALSAPGGLVLSAVLGVRVSEGVVSSDLPSRHLLLSGTDSSLFSVGVPLVNTNGDLVGIVEGVAEGHPTILPLESILPAIQTFLRSGRVDAASLGASGIALSTAMGLPDKLRRGYETGFLLSGRTAAPVGSAAARAGLRAGDILLQVNGQTIDREHPLDELVLVASPGDVWTVSFDRALERKEAQVELGARP